MEKTKLLEQSLAQLNACLRSAALPTLSVVEQRLDENRVELTDGEQRYLAWVQVWAPQQSLETLQGRLRRLRQYRPGARYLLLADYINPVMAERLNQASLWFADCSGNLLWRHQRRRLFVKRRKDSRPQRPARRGRAFNPVGIKLIFAFFNSPELLGRPYRVIAREVGVALGSIGPVLDDLRFSGYLQKDRDAGLQLVHKKRLFERWVDAYLEKLRPGLLLGRYRSQRVDWWKSVDINRYVAQWGGEITIAGQTPFLLPEQTTVYCSEDELARFVDDCELVPAAEGDVQIFHAFWLQHLITEEASKMIVYADLIDSVDPGTWEVAKTFYAEAISGLLDT